MKNDNYTLVVVIEKRGATRSESDLCESLREVVDDVLIVLGADAETYGGWIDVLLLEFLGRELRVGGGGGMDDKALHVGHISQEGEDLEMVRRP